MGKSTKNVLSKKKLVAICAAIVIGVSTIGGGAYYAHIKAEEVRIEKERILEEQRKVEEARRIEEERLARIEYFEDTDIAYLTFDDGPSPVNTPKVLDVLKENNIKATFFVLGDMVKNNPEIVKRIHEEGHSIANHTRSHKYRHASEEAFLEEITYTDKAVSEAIGEEYKSLYVRVPGGSFGKKMQKEALSSNGYIDLNWSALSGDSEGTNISSKYTLERIDETVGDNQYEVVLLHDIKKITADNLQKIIDSIKEKGYVFEALTEETPHK